MHSSQLVKMTKQPNPLDLVVPFVVMDLENGKKKAVFGVPKENASSLVVYPILCRGGCFTLEIDEEGEGETTFLSAIFDSIEADKTAEAISHRLAARVLIEEPTPINAESLLGVGRSS
mmetsp:Transcript_26821/g.48577  ORF Transcript_26821/g.48577 Transcript_26821/m.48577 type:complete len:118 (-) Transcript_26821:38-391(-)